VISFPFAVLFTKKNPFRRLSDHVLSANNWTAGFSLRRVHARRVPAFLTFATTGERGGSLTRRWSTGRRPRGEMEPLAPARESGLLLIPHFIVLGLARESRHSSLADHRVLLRCCFQRAKWAPRACGTSWWVCICGGGRAVYAYFFSSFLTDTYPAVLQPAVGPVFGPAGCVRTWHTFYK